MTAALGKRTTLVALGTAIALTSSPLYGQKLTIRGAGCIGPCQSVACCDGIIIVNKDGIGFGRNFDCREFLRTASADDRSTFCSLVRAQQLKCASCYCTACPVDPTRTVSVHVGVAFPEPALNNELAGKTLTERFGDREAKGDRGVGGFADIDVALPTDSNVTWVALAGDASTGEGCTFLDSISLSLKVNAVTLYVAAEFTPGSCRYGAILDHEREHANLVKVLTNEYAEKLAADLKSDRLIAAPSTPGRYCSADEILAIERQTLDRVKAVVAEAVKELNSESIKRTKALDTAATYEEVERRCAQRP